MCPVFLAEGCVVSTLSDNGALWLCCDCAVSKQTSVEPLIRLGRCTVYCGNLEIPIYILFLELFSQPVKVDHQQDYRGLAVPDQWQRKLPHLEHNHVT